jgi:hypothetical protein
MVGDKNQSAGAICLPDKLLSVLQLVTGLGLKFP